MTATTNYSFIKPSSRLPARDKPRVDDKNMDLVDAAIKTVANTVPAFAAPTVVLSTAAAAGAASTVIRSDSTIAAFDATAPTTSALADAAATGSAAFAARRDHKHGRESFATNALVLGTAAAAGAATTPMRSNDTIAAFDATVPVTQAFSDAAATGSAAFAARRDHKHGMPASPSSKTFFGGNGGGTSLAVGTSGYLGIGTPLVAGAAENTRWFFIPFAGTLKNLRIATLTAQSASTHMDITVQVEALGTALTVTVPTSGSATTYSDLVNTVSVSAGQVVSIKVSQIDDGGGGGSGQVGGYSVEIDPS